MAACNLVLSKSMRGWKLAMSCFLVPSSPLDTKTESVGLCRMCTPLDLGYETEFVGLRRFCTVFLGHWDLMSEL